MRWQPERLDDLLEEPFEEIERMVQDDILARLDLMKHTLDEIEAELDQIIEERNVSVC